jgi:peptidoglycan/LPS O-acetylase OafA/YrhL
MPVRFFPVLLVLVTAFADRAGDRRLAFYALLGAVVAASVAALTAVGEHAEGRADRGQVALWALVLMLSVVGSATRAPGLGDGSTPPLARWALVASLASFCLLALAAMLAELRSRTGDLDLLHADRETVLEVLAERGMRLDA